MRPHRSTGARRPPANRPGRAALGTPETGPERQRVIAVRFAGTASPVRTVPQDRGGDQHADDHGGDGDGQAEPETARGVRAGGQQAAEHRDPDRGAELATGVERRRRGAASRVGAASTAREVMVGTSIPPPSPAGSNASRSGYWAPSVAVTPMKATPIPKTLCPRNSTNVEPRAAASRGAGSSRRVRHGGLT